MQTYSCTTSSKKTPTNNNVAKPEKLFLPPKKILLQIPAGYWYPRGIGKKIDEYGDERLRKVTVGPFGSEEKQKWAENPKNRLDGWV